MRVLARGFAVFALMLVGTSTQALSAREAQGPGADAPAAAASAAAPPPTEHDRALVDALIANDIEAVAIQLNRDSQEEIAREWERNRLRDAKSELAPYADAYAERIWALLVNPERTTELANELHSQFVEQANTAVADFNRDLARVLASIASDDDLSPSEAQQISQLWLAV